MSHDQIRVADVAAALQRLAPIELSEVWDKTGLQVGWPDQPVEQVLLALDVTAPVLDKAIDHACQLIICHHPLIFTPLDTLRGDNPGEALILRLIQAHISVLVAHTNLDCAPGGVADALAERLRQHLQPPGRAAGGLGRYGRLLVFEQPLLLSELAGQLRRILGAAGCRGNTDQDRPVSRLAVYPGAFAEDCLADLALMAIDCVICGEIKHHVGLALALSGIAVLDTGHDVSERVVLEPLADRLAELLPQVRFAVDAGLDYNKHVF